MMMMMMMTINRAMMTMMWLLMMLMLKLTMLKDWKLVLQGIAVSDSGEYQCQVLFHIEYFQTIFRFFDIQFFLFLGKHTPSLTYSHCGDCSRYESIITNDADDGDGDDDCNDGEDGADDKEEEI